MDARDPRSNERMAREALLDHVPMPRRDGCIRCGAAAGPRAPAAPARLARKPAAAAQRAADDYEALLRSIFAAGGGIDLVLLGLGDNGHTASLFPGSDVLDERERWVVAALEDPARRRPRAAPESGCGG